MDERYLALTQQLSELGLLYVHVLDHSAMGTPAAPAELEARLRAAFRGLCILAGGFDQVSAERALKAGQADLIAFAWLTFQDPKQFCSSRGRRVAFERARSFSLA